MASLQVKVISALLTRDTQTFSNMDPYTIIEVGGQKRKTRTHQEGGKKPMWNDVFSFTNPKGNMIKFTVMDEDVMSDDLVGDGVLYLDKFIKNPTEQSQYVPLTYKGKASGKLYVSIFYKTGNNQPIYPGNQINNNNFNPYNNNQNQGWGNNVQNNNQTWGNNVQNNQGWGTNNTNTQGWGNNNTNTQGQGTNVQKNNQGWGTNNTNTQGWGTNNTNNQGWGNTQNTQGWGSNQNNQGWGSNPQISQGWGNTQNNNNPQYPSLNVQNTGNDVNQQLGQQIFNNLIKPNSQQNIPMQNNAQKTNVLGILNVALNNGINQTQPPQNSGWNNQPGNSGWGTNQQPINKGGNTNPYQINKGNNGW